MKIDLFHLNECQKMFDEVKNTASIEFKFRFFALCFNRYQQCTAVDRVRRYVCKIFFHLSIKIEGNSKQYFTNA